MTKMSNIEQIVWSECVLHPIFATKDNDDL